MVHLPLWVLFLLVLLVLGLGCLGWYFWRVQRDLWEDRVVRFEERLALLERRVADEGLPALREDLRQAHEELRHLSGILAGRRSGQAAERVLEEALAVLPQDWVLRDVPLGKGRVEFALRLPGGYLVPLDSKFVTSGEEDLPERELRRRLKARVEEVLKYLSDARTLGFGLAVVPEGVYALCRPLVASLASQALVVVSYSQLVPVLTSLYLLAKHLGLAEKPEEARQDLLLAREALSRALQALAKQQSALSQFVNRREEAWRELSQLERILERLTEKGASEGRQG